MKNKYILFLLILFVGSNILIAQPFANDITSFKKKDSIHEPFKHAILFVGSSSFTKWRDMDTYFPSHKIINRGFGGSTIPDVIRYEQDVIFKYQPKQIVIYCGENDVAASDTVSGKIVYERFKKLFTDIRVKFPHTPIIYISMKPSPLRWQMKDRLAEGNKLIKSFLKKKKHSKFINIWNNMLDKNGIPEKEIFGDDHLHMNAKGYAIWQKLIEPYLVKN
jgi:lysophospholipase L1-like esterase